VVFRTWRLCYVTATSRDSSPRTVPPVTADRHYQTRLPFLYAQQDVWDVRGRGGTRAAGCGRSDVTTAGRRTLTHSAFFRCHHYFLCAGLPWTVSGLLDISSVPAALLRLRGIRFSIFSRAGWRRHFDVGRLLGVLTGGMLTSSSLRGWRRVVPLRRFVLSGARGAAAFDRFPPLPLAKGGRRSTGGLDGFYVGGRGCDGVVEPALTRCARRAVLPSARFSFRLYRYADICQRISCKFYRLRFPSFVGFSAVTFPV